MGKRSQHRVEQPPLIGRRSERELLQKFNDAAGAAFLAIYGRRRVGKTHLVRAMFSDCPAFLEVTGRKDGTRATQLDNFALALEQCFGGVGRGRFAGWREAFDALTHGLEGLPRHRRCVIFFDELPWLATPRSGLLEELDYFWNMIWSRDPRVRLIVCGSAASWMLDHLVNAKGGLHNRLTHRLLLAPFSLPQAQEYLLARNVRWSRELLTEAYMATGGVPFYLNLFEGDATPAEAIQGACFQPDGILYDEFERLFSSLFRKSDRHVRLVRALAGHGTGMTREQVLVKAGLRSGGSFNTPVNELEAAGFVQKFIPFRHQTRDQWFRLIDEYALFYLRWIEPVRGRGVHIPSRHWQVQSQTPAYRVWAGYAFEGICMKHTDALLEALGISGIAAEVSSWRYVPSSRSLKQGAQIDLVIDRADRIISLCEVKFTSEPFAITKAYAAKLREKMAVFREQTGTTKHLQLVLVAPAGLKRNMHSDALGVREVTLRDLFR